MVDISTPPHPSVSRYPQEEKKTNKKQTHLAVGQNRVTPKWLALVSGSMAQNLRSDSSWFDFDPYPQRVLLPLGKKKHMGKGQH